ncbi:MAG: hypothetical protein H6710_00805 [Myxococcales bacterium]|nr:hypothetical protein [Myxococcales bacterium]MCB9703090.1 hypothetical protein [Myxococcales bacterium]
MSRQKHVFALFPDHQSASQALDALVAAGCESEHCSALLHERVVDEHQLTMGERATREGAVKGAEVGATLGPILGALVSIGGGIVGLGPLAVVATATGMLSAYGALVGIIAGSSEPEEHIRRIQAALEAGQALIAVEVDEPALAERARTILLENGGRTVEDE